MDVIDVELSEESKTRYLTYALSVVNSRALPDVRDGLKPVQRRILYAMYENLRLLPDRFHRKSAAVVGEVLGRYHPHGDVACYEAMVRMAQPFSVRYTLVDGQGNFGSLDGDSAAAYRYTEAKLTALALEVLGDIDHRTVDERDNFDQTVKEPVVLPTRVPHLLMNGASGIAVGMATSIPPHNLADVVRALLVYLEDDTASDARLVQAIKGPDFPTGCSICNTREELRQIYATGRGAIRMRGEYTTEQTGRERPRLVITSIPYGVEKSGLVERIADLIIEKKVRQLVDVRDESTDIVRIVCEITPDADADKVAAFLYKHTPLEQLFHVNMTALVPTSNPLSGRPSVLPLREILAHFVQFRAETTRRKLQFEKEQLEDRLHLLEGLLKVVSALDEALKIVRKSTGRSDGAEKLMKRFQLTERQAYFIVDLRIYQLSQTSLDEIEEEHRIKRARVKEIEGILKDEKKVRALIAEDLARVQDSFGDARRSKILHEYEEVVVEKDEFTQHEDVYVVVSQDGWLKRIRQTADPSSTRLREGDSALAVLKGSTKDVLVLFSNYGNVFGMPVMDVSHTAGFGEPVQKIFKFKDGEQVIHAMLAEANQQAGTEYLLYTRRGIGYRASDKDFGATKKAGKRAIRLAEGDVLGGIVKADGDLLLTVTASGYGLLQVAKEVPLLSLGAKGVHLMKVGHEDSLVGVVPVKKKTSVLVELERSVKEVSCGSLTIGSRAQKGDKLIARGGPVKGVTKGGIQ